jgi:hypothetical protein
MTTAAETLNPTGVDLVVQALRAVRRREGIDEAMDVAKEMIFDASSILACEIGVEGARAVLAAAAQVLTDRYGRALQ